MDTMNITIQTPYAQADRYTGIWANEEERINFRKEPDRALRCTISFAAMQLKEYLLKTLSHASITFSNQTAADTDVLLSLDKISGDCDDEYHLIPLAGPSGVRIEGCSRRSILYGVYEFLKLQGWRWYYPDDGGEIAPSLRDTLQLPERPLVFKPAMEFSRGFDLSESYAYPSRPFLMWMIRNRMNVAICREPTAALSRKLGFISKYGGHIFESMLAPDKPWDNGRDLFDTHPEWYGLPENGLRQREKALSVQLCVAHDDMFDYLAEELLAKLNHEWYEHDRIDIWGFDTWGSACSCDVCQTIGNNTDRAVYFLSQLRQRLDRAMKDERLDHPVQLVMCSYEGTYTLAAPQKPAPANLLAAGDSVVYYPINRCYEHCVEDSHCATNRRYATTISDWEEAPCQLPRVIGEYYNVSKYEDLPLLFTHSMLKDLPYYYRKGFCGITYMHVPMMHWGLRALTHVLYAELAWTMKETSSMEDVSPYLADYFSGLYGRYASRMNVVYQLVEKSSLTIASWRAWDGNSILSQLLKWDGKKPVQPLSPNGHFADGILADGQRIAKILQQTVSMVDAMIQEEKTWMAREGAVTIQQAVNPDELRKLNTKDQLLQRLTVVHRQLLYGRDVARLSVAVCRYHQALLREHDAEADLAWDDVETYERALERYYMPITGYNANSLLVNDAMIRSQLRPVISRCRAQRTMKLAQQKRG